MLNLDFCFNFFLQKKETESDFIGLGLKVSMKEEEVSSVYYQYLSFCTLS